MTTKTFVYFTTDKMFYVKTPSNRQLMFNRWNDVDEVLYQCLKTIKESGNDNIRLLYLNELNTFFLRNSTYEELNYLTDLTVKIKVKERRF